MKNLMKTRSHSLWLAAAMGVFVFNSCTEDATIEESTNAIQKWAGAVVACAKDR